MKISEDKKENPEMEPDDQLVRAFQSGRQNAFDQLVLRYKDRVFTICYRFLGKQQDAYDMAQEIFIKVYRNLHDFRGEAAFYTWLYRITVNTCKNRLKSLEFRYLKKQVALFDPGSAQVENQETIADPQPTPLTILEKRETRATIQKAIGSLPREQKMMIILRDIEGLAYEEIMQLTGLRLGTVKSKLARARILLREKLKGVI